MSKRRKIDKIHEKIMVSSHQINILSKFIKYYADNENDMTTLAGIIHEKSSRINKENERLGLLFGL